MTKEDYPVQNSFNYPILRDDSHTRSALRRGGQALAMVLRSLGQLGEETTPNECSTRILSAQNGFSPSQNDVEIRGVNASIARDTLTHRGSRGEKRGRAAEPLLPVSAWNQGQGTAQRTILTGRKNVRPTLKRSNTAASIYSDANAFTTSPTNPLASPNNMSVLSM